MEVGLTEILLCGLIASLVGFLFWERLNIQRVMREQTNMSAALADTYRADAQTRGDEIVAERAMIERLLVDGRNDRELYLGMVQNVTDKFMSRNLKEFATYNTEHLNERPAPEPMTDYDEAYEELVTNLMSQHRVGREAAEHMVQKAQSAEYSEHPVTRDLRTVLAQAEISNRMTQGVAVGVSGNGGRNDDHQTIPPTDEPAGSGTSDASDSI